MYKNSVIKVLSIMLLACCVSLTSGAFPTANYASQSALSNGMWIKIAVAKDGVYQISYDELRQMGIGNPENVRIYGEGGHMKSEVLNGTATDDLKQIPVLHTDADGGKVCFYANGPVQFTLTNPTSANAYFKRTVNTYSSYGYYFITDSNGSTLNVSSVAAGAQASEKRDYSLDYDWHEQDLASYSQSGKDLLGEELKNNSTSYSTRLYNIVEGSPVVVNTCIGAKTTAPAYIGTIVNGSDVPFSSSRAKIYQPSSTYVYYNSASPVAAVALGYYSEDVDVEASLSCPTGSVTSARLDYVTLTYQHTNAFHDDDNGQFRMHLNNLTSSQRIEFPDNPEDIVVWNIDNPQNPVEYKTTTYTYEEDGETKTVKAFSPGMESTWAQFIVFDPTKELLRISSYENVPNQSLHGIPVPDMLIIANENFIDQAYRIADMHQEKDGISVAVVNQEEIYNEFSSGTPDAMAYRLFCKMLYDRNRSKFKYLLLFGAGSYDNRALVASRDYNVLTYQTTTSNDEDYSYTSDDFFGLLDDNSGTNIASDMLRIGVGRFPSKNIEEATSDVDKLVEYVLNPDYGEWRNNIMLAADEGDDGLHMFQAEGVQIILDDEFDAGLQANRVYVPQFPKANETWITDVSRRTATEAKRQMKNYLEQGQYFASYVGHAGPTGFTKTSHMWTSNDAQSTAYSHMPIFTTAACDVARYDSDQRGIAEHMFHKRDGGAIALLTSSRSVYAESNDALNTAFVRNMFCYNTLGYMPTLGYTYMKAKQSFGTASNINKMSFLLLGDPAMKINYPKSLIQITKVDNKSISGDSIDIYPMTQVAVQANILDEDRSAVDASFNGDVTISLYDAENYFNSYTQRTMGSTAPTTRDIYYTRDLLSQTQARATNGVINATIVVPREVIANGRQGLIRIYAHRDNSDDMVNGFTSKIRIATYDESQVTIIDTEAPQITEMYIGDDSFADGSTIDPNSTLYISVTDDVGLSSQSVAICNNMTLMLDGGTSLSTVKNYAVTTEDNGMKVSFPLSGLSSGRHTLSFTVYDLAGNMATRSISFVVGGDFVSPILTVNETPASTTATFNLTHELSEAPTVTLKVLDVHGDIIWSATTAEFPYTWDLTTNAGTRIPAGVYDYYGTVRAGSSYGGTKMNKIIVVEPLKSSN